MSTPSFSLLTFVLPLEILENHVLPHVGPETLLILKRSCQALNEIAGSDHLWRRWADARYRGAALAFALAPTTVPPLLVAETKPCSYQKLWACRKNVVLAAKTGCYQTRGGTLFIAEYRKCTPSPFAWLPKWLRAPPRPYGAIITSCVISKTGAA